MRQDLLVDVIGRDAGRLIALQGDRRTVSSLLISLAVRLQAGTKVTLIDAGDTFNAAFLNEEYHKATSIDVRNIMVARPLSAIELKDLTLRLEASIKHQNSKVLVISGLDELFYKEPMATDDLLFLFTSVFEELLRITRTLDLVTLVGIGEHGDLAAIAGKKSDFVARV